MRVSLLGPLLVEVGGIDVTPSAAKPRAVLAVLALHPGQVVPVPALLEELWGEDLPATALTILQTYVYQLRRILAAAPEGTGRLVTRAPGYLLAVDPDHLDVHRFDALHDRAGRELAEGRLAEGSRTLRGALELWRGDALDGVRCGRLLRAHAAALAERRLAAAEARLEVELTLGRHAHCLAELRDLTAGHPLHEGFHALLMTALARSDRRSEALQVYHEIRRRLRRELRIEPSATLRRAQAAILRGAAAGAGPVPPRPTQLPPAPVDFQGRAAELATLDVALRRPSAVVAVTGPIGVGKTVLAARAGHRHADRFPDGQLFLDLGGATRGPLAPAEALARVLRAVRGPEASVPEDPASRVAAYREWTSSRRVLVVLDGAASAAQVLPLLPAGPGCATLVTSRIPLPGLPVTDRCAVGSLGRDEALGLLAAVGGAGRVAVHPDAAARLVRDCGHHPMVVRAVAERVRLDRFADLADLAGRLARDDDRATELRAHDPVLVRWLDAVCRPLIGPARAARVGHDRLPPVLTAAQLHAPPVEPGRLPAVRRLVASGLLVPAGPDHLLPEPVRLCLAARSAPAPQG